jgi:anti-sigma regulatory factor (Ser/Thr protein kinase)
MVSLLWDEGHVVAAIELEALWNDLARMLPFSLLCAYRADSVLGAGQADALARVCASHSSVLEGPLRDCHVSAQFPTTIDAPRAARHFVVDVMRQWGYAPELIEDAALVVTEFAANAVVHAASAFTVVVRGEDEVVHLGVQDAVPVEQSSLIVRPGRGLGLVARLAHRWGMDVSGVGKTMWAELGGFNL